MIPAAPPGPLDERAQTFLTSKRESVALAEQRLPASTTIWMEDTLHDIPLHRPAELAQAIEEFVAKIG